VRVPFTNAEVTSPDLKELAALSPAKAVAHPKLGPQIAEAIKRGRAAWAADAKEKGGAVRVFEI
jgi:hypothetical protein